MKIDNKDTVNVILVSLLLALEFIQVCLYSQGREYTDGLIFETLIELHIWVHIFGRGDYIQGAY